MTTFEGPTTMPCAQQCEVPAGVRIAWVPPTDKAFSDVVRCPNDGCERTFLVLADGRDVTTAPKASEPDPDVHNSTERGCDACGTCMAHDGCADPDNPHNGPRGDCAQCGACGDCVRACAEQRARDNAPYSSEANRG